MSDPTANPNINKPVATYIPGRVLETDYPLIDNDPHFKRVLRYARPSDYLNGAAALAFGPGSYWLSEKISPSLVGRGGVAQGLRMSTGIGAMAGFLIFYQVPSLRFYGALENQREVDMDMREMVEKVKKGEPLYGVSTLTKDMQGVAARQSRYSAIFFAILPWFNFVNHNQHGVDTAKYYRQAELELEADRLAREAPGSPAAIDAEKLAKEAYRPFKEKADIRSADYRSADF